MINALKAIISDPERVVSAEEIEEKYLSDSLGRLRGTAGALVFPTDTEEVSAVMAYAYQNDIPVTPRGAGTNLVGSTIPRGGIILDFSRMDKILEVDPDTFTATVQPGILLKDFQAYVEERGLFYPPDPGEKASTIGGNISTNAGGMRAVKYGVTRDYVRGLELVLADGTVTTVGSKNVKDASGLSLKNLIIGSEGTLAVITKCILRLLPKPEMSRSVLIAYPDLSTGISSVLKVIKANAGPTAIEFVERSVWSLANAIRASISPAIRAMPISCSPSTEEKAPLPPASSVVRGVAEATGAADFIVLDTPELISEVWQIRGCLVKAVEATSEQEPVDLVVPIDRTAEFISYVHKVEKESGMQMVSFGHAGDGNVHLCIVRGARDDATWTRELHANMEKIYGKAYSLGGLTSGRARHRHRQASLLLRADVRGQSRAYARHQGFPRPQASFERSYFICSNNGKDNFVL